LKWNWHLKNDYCWIGEICITNECDQEWRSWSKTYNVMTVYVISIRQDSIVMKLKGYGGCILIFTCVWNSLIFLQRLPYKSYSRLITSTSKLRYYNIHESSLVYIFEICKNMRNFNNINMYNAVQIANINIITIVKILLPEFCYVSVLSMLIQTV
jgi:hypothetical protein